MPESVEVVSALEVTGADVVTLCNSGSLFGDARLVVVTEVDGRKKEENRPPTGGWKAADVEAIAAYLAAPAPGSVLALVGLEVKKDAALAKACAKAGDVLLYDVAKRGRVAWVAERFRQAGVKAETDACALLVEYVGEDDLHGLANEIDKIATWAQGEPVGVAEIEQLVSPVADVPPFALTDAWAERHPGRLLDLSETMFDRSDKPRRDTAPQARGDARRASRPGCASSSASPPRACRPARPRRRSRCIRSTARRSTARPRASPTRSSRARPSGSPSSISR